MTLQRASTPDKYQMSGGGGGGGGGNRKWDGCRESPVHDSKKTKQIDIFNILNG